MNEYHVGVVMAAPAAFLRGSDFPPLAIGKARKQLLQVLRCVPHDIRVSDNLMKCRVLTSPGHISQSHTAKSLQSGWMFVGGLRCRDQAANALDCNCA